MKTSLKFLMFAGMLTSCINVDKPEIQSENAQIDQIKMTLEEATRLIDLPLACIEIEYPNKLNQVIGAESDLRNPKALHPAFYGCFDWHSAVHGHWSLVRLLRLYPEIEGNEKAIEGLANHLTKENIMLEVDYFENEINQGFERMYGWAWLLKLADEIHQWEHPAARELEENLKPLTDLIEKKVIGFLPKLAYPIRVGTHTNTAFALSLIYDYSITLKKNNLKLAVENRARKFYFGDIEAPLSWEPSGYDFLSPCLEEANLMRRILTEDEFRAWLKAFLPGMEKKDFKLEPGIVTDRTDGHLVHLDGLNFSRAWCLYGIAETLPEYGHLIAVGNEHINHSLPGIVDGNYEGGHWLASFALLAIR